MKWIVIRFFSTSIHQIVAGLKASGNAGHQDSVYDSKTAQKICYDCHKSTITGHTPAREIDVTQVDLKTTFGWNSFFLLKV